VMKMNQRIKKILIISVLASYAFLAGWANSLEEIKQEAKSVWSIQADFIQEKHLKVLKKPLISEGAIYFQDPQCLRWEYTRPIRSILVMNSEHIKRYVISGEEVIESDSAALLVMQVFLKEVIMWMHGDFDQNPNFTTELNPNQIILLKPKDKSMSKLIEKIELKLTDTPGVIKSATIYESPTTYTVIKFQNTKINKPIEDSVFQGP